VRRSSFVLFRGGGVAGWCRDAQVILTSSELLPSIGKTNADVIVIDNFFDLDELTAKLETALG
jgi:galactitol-specific phosphotransferase system IIB component